MKFVLACGVLPVSFEETVHAWMDHPASPNSQQAEIVVQG